MSICVHSQANLTVAKDFHQISWLNILRAEQGSRRVPEIMETQLRKARPLEQSFIVPRKIIAIDWRTVAHCEYEIGLMPSLTGFQLRS